MKLILPMAIGMLLCVSDAVLGCGGSRGGPRSSSGFASSASTGGGRPISVSNSTPYGNAMAAVSTAREAAAAKAHAYNARMRPIRMANAKKVREQKLARREAFKRTMLARSASQKKAEQLFLADARPWIDASGKHKTQAILVKASDWGVQLKKRDGTTINVPMDRLSHDDRYYVSNWIGQPKFETLIAGL